MAYPPTRREPTFGPAQNRDPYTGFPVNSGSTYYTENLAKNIGIWYAFRIISPVIVGVVVLAMLFIAGHFGVQTAVYFWVAMCVLLPGSVFIYGVRVMIRGFKQQRYNSGRY